MLLRDNFTSSTTDWSWVCSIIILNALDWFEKLWSVVDMRKWYCRHRAVPQQKDHKIKSITQSDLECTYTPRNSTSLSHPSPTSYTRSLLAGISCLTCSQWSSNSCWASVNRRPLWYFSICDVSQSWSFNDQVQKYAYSACTSQPNLGLRRQPGSLYALREESTPAASLSLSH